MNPLDRLAVRLSLTRAEISVISLLVAFLLLGGIVRNFHSARDADALVKERERERFSEKIADSLLASVSAFAAIPSEETAGTPGRDHDTDEAFRAGDFGTEEAPVHEKRTTAGRSGKKTFNGTLGFNKATEKQLQQIPGVGPVMAKRLVAFRASKGGRIERHEDLLEVKGIGEKKLEVLKKYLTLE
ncbi:MAG: helix-hairpin-helix domain-containing protein [Chlorobi bacterium]|nr:helix-hairpin-helix domain-containing protein [Chlorobiota bacterium]